MTKYNKKNSIFNTTNYNDNAGKSIISIIITTVIIYFSLTLKRKYKFIEDSETTNEISRKLRADEKETIRTEYKDKDTSHYKYINDILTNSNDIEMLLSYKKGDKIWIPLRKKYKLEKHSNRVDKTILLVKYKIDGKFKIFFIYKNLIG